MVKKEYVIHIKKLKQALNHGLVLKKVCSVIKVNKKAWLKPYIEMNTELRKKAKNDFFTFMISSVFRITMENMRKHRGIKLVATEKRRNYLVSESNYYTTNFLSQTLLATEMKKTRILTNKPIYKNLPTLELSKIVMCESWYDYVKLKNKEKVL